jgi:hypothetical protein
MLSDDHEAVTRALAERGSQLRLRNIAVRHAEVLHAAVFLLTRNPAKLAGPNPMPAPREIRVYTPDELKAIVAELGPLEAAAGEVSLLHRPTSR